MYCIIAHYNLKVKIITRVTLWGLPAIDGCKSNIQFIQKVQIYDCVRLSKGRILD
jgi:hypothetical protein